MTIDRVQVQLTELYDLGYRIEVRAADQWTRAAGRLLGYAHQVGATWAVFPDRRYRLGEVVASRRAAIDALMRRWPDSRERDTGRIGIALSMLVLTGLAVAGGGVALAGLPRPWGLVGAVPLLGVLTLGAYVLSRYARRRAEVRRSLEIVDEIHQRRSQ